MLCSQYENKYTCPSVSATFAVEVTVVSAVHVMLIVVVGRQFLELSAPQVQENDDAAYVPVFCHFSLPDPDICWSRAEC